MSYSFSRRILSSLVKWRIASLSGLEHIPLSGPAILVANHVGEQDALLLSAAIASRTHGRKAYTIAKWKILSFPLWKKWLGIIPLLPDRAQTIQLTKKILQYGELVLIFPEGGVGTTSTIGKVKTGAARLALMTKIPVIPIGLKRTSPTPKTELAYVLEIIYGRAHITIGAPIDLKPWYNKPLDVTTITETNNAIMNQVAGLANKTYNPNGTEPK